MLGFGSPSRSLITAVKEAVDNALDVCEDMRQLPDIKINVEKVGQYIKVEVTDNGPGIPKDNIGDVFGSILYGSRFGETIQSRGQQGIGISAAVLYSQISTNEKAIITTKTSSMEKANKLHIGIDIENNKPDIDKEEEVEWDQEHGTKISLKIRANLRSRDKLIEYIEETSIANPHARIEYDGIKMEKTYERATEDLPEKPTEIKPHPHGIDKGELVELLEQTESYSLKGFLQEEFSKVGSKTADEILGKFKDEIYGRKIPKKLDDNELKEIFEQEISNKKQEDIDLFRKYVEKEVGNISSTAKLEGIIEEAAEKVEEENDTRLGKTVRDNVVNGLISSIRNKEDYSYIFSNIKETTSSRKSDKIVRKISDEIINNIEDKESISFGELTDIVNRVAKNASDTTGDSYGDTAIEKTINSLWSLMERQNKDIPNINDIINGEHDIDMTYNAIVESLRFSMTNTKVSRPSSKCLSPITPEKLEKGMRNNYEGDFCTAKIRKTSSYSGHPFTVEAGIIYGEDYYNSEDRIELHRFANRVPLIYQKGSCLITKAVKGINWRNYSPKGDKSISQSGASGIPQGPFRLIVHLASTNVPFTSESKDAIASQEIIEKEIEQAIREVARDLKSYLSKKHKKRKKRQKREQINRMLPDIARIFADISGEEVPDTGMVLSNITESIVVRMDTGKIGVYNNTGTRRKIRILLKGVKELPDDSEFEEEDGEYVWEELVYSSNEYPDIKVGDDYEKIVVTNVEDDMVLVEDKRED